jgi:hypothetical protein
MQNTNTGLPAVPTNDTDVNQTDHISAQLEQEESDPENTDDVEEDEDEEDDDVPDEEDLEENNVTDEETDDIEWDPNQQAGDKGDGQTL